MHLLAGCNGPPRDVECNEGAAAEADRPLQEDTRKLANFVKPAGRGLPLVVPPSTAGRAHPGAAAEAAVTAAWSGPQFNILPLSMVAVSGPPAGAAAITSPLTGARG
jgi:hypothetical protein